ncbi:uncharacterized protein [Cicer arietinum]|uniref:Uncharacterized protein LOC101491406 n=1 Tax=Cicer arietinum TaxID=3827 RepID=A0A1S2YUS6_CICAR|nr:uncharacterized protein LOC101491406 [Cicer arietinum]
MASSHGCCPHHHRNHCPHCPLRRHCHHCPLHFSPSLIPQTQTQSHNQNQNQPQHAQISQELEHIVLDGDEEDDEPVFVLTDEWREFFAKSEAKRKLEKQAKKGKK